MTKRFLLLGLLAVLNGAAIAQTPVFRLAATPGPHPVGARVVYHHDSTRSFHGQPRPIQSLVWYPAQTAGPPIRWGDYALLDLTDTIRRSLSPADSQAFRQTGIYRRFLADSALIHQHIDQAGVATWNAPARPGRFPVVLYAASFGASVWENAAFAEYVASHGYVVVAVPSVGASTRAMTADAAGLQAQVGDIRFVVAWVQRQPWWNGADLGLVGFSWGGTSGPIAALDPNLPLGAVVAWDGSIRYRPRTVEAAAGIDSLRPFPLRVPFLYFSSRRNQQPGTKPPAHQPVADFDLWYRIPEPTPKGFLRWDRLEHGDFSMNHLIFEQHGHPDPTPVAERHRQYGLICQLTKAFLDQQIRRIGPGLQIAKRFQQREGVYWFATGL